MKENGINIASIGKGIVFSLFLTFAFVFLLAAVCCIFTITDRTLFLSVYIAIAFSVFIPAFLVARAAGFSGFIHGLFVGIGYFIFMNISDFVMNKEFSFGMSFLLMAVFVILSGILGGILGINAKK